MYLFALTMYLFALNLGYAIMFTRYYVPGILPAMLRWARRCATHEDRMFERVHSFSYWHLFARLSPVTNSPLNTVFIFILLCLCITFRTRSSTISLTSSRNWQDSMCPEFITAPICGFWTLYQSHVILVLHCIRHPLVQNVHAPRLSNFRVARYERSTIV